MSRVAPVEVMDTPPAESGGRSRPDGQALPGATRRVEATAGGTGETADAGTDPDVRPPVPILPGSSGRRAGMTASRGLLLAAGAVAVLATWVWLQSGVDPGRVMLAVLPFANLSGDPGQEYLADGLTEETITWIGRIDPDHVRVTSRTAVMPYKGSTGSLAAIGGALGVDYVLEGSLRSEGGRIRVATRLRRVRDGVQIWSERFDREPASLLAVQQELSTAIAEQIGLRLSPERAAALSRRQPRQPEAGDYYLRGRYYANQRTPATMGLALEYYAKAVDIDPEYALAWAGIADAHASRPINSDVPSREVEDRAHEAAVRAVGAEPDLAEAQLSLGRVHYFFTWDWAAAERAFRHAADLDPHHGFAHQMLGHVLSQTGRPGEAQAALRRAREIDPLSTMHLAISSQVAFQAREYAEAVEHATGAMAIDPEFWIAYMQLGQAYERLGETDRAFEALATAIRLSGRNSKPFSLRAYVLATTGQEAAAREELRRLEELSLERYVPPYARALVYAGLGDDSVFEWLERALEERDVHLIFLPVDPKWDAFRPDPRFAALLQRCGFTLTPGASAR